MYILVLGTTTFPRSSIRESLQSQLEILLSLVCLGVWIVHICRFTVYATRPLCQIDLHLLNGQWNILKFHCNFILVLSLATSHCSERCSRGYPRALFLDESQLCVLSMSIVQVYLNRSQSKFIRIINSRFEVHTSLLNPWDEKKNVLELFSAASEGATKTCAIASFVIIDGFRTNVMAPLLM